MNFNPAKHHRHSIRLRGFDYSQAGLYFITICVKDHICIFGNVVNMEMVLNNAGKFADECWNKIPDHFPNAILHEYTIMPKIVRGFKIGVIKWFRENSHGIQNPDLFKNAGCDLSRPIWQRNYYEHVIRNENSYQIL